MLERCKADGWRLTLIYLWLPAPGAALARVTRRVGEGGHSIPPDVIVRMYFADIANMRNAYLPLADEAEIYDNSDRARIMIAEKRESHGLLFHDSKRWAEIEEATD